MSLFQTEDMRTITASQESHMRETIKEYKEKFMVYRREVTEWRSELKQAMEENP